MKMSVSAYREFDGLKTRFCLHLVSGPKCRVKGDPTAPTAPRRGGSGVRGAVGYLAKKEGGSGVREAERRGAVGCWAKKGGQWGKKILYFTLSMIHNQFHLHFSSSYRAHSSLKEN